MKKIFTLVLAAAAVFAMNAQVNSTYNELSPKTFVEETADQAWVFQNNISMKVTGKSYASAQYASGTDTVPFLMLKISKEKAATITIPSTMGVVKVDFIGVSNSSAMNWAYLQSFSNTADYPIMTAEERQVKDNAAIQALKYPISPDAKSVSKPFASFTSEKGTAWFEELNFMIDGNNQIAANIILWTVAADDVEKWDPATDKTLTGIESVVIAPSKGVVYNLQGQIVGEDYQGIVIKDGKKYLNK